MTFNNNNKAFIRAELIVAVIAVEAEVLVAAVVVVAAEKSLA